MTAASLFVDLGPCDDNAYLYVNGRLVIAAGLGENRQFQRDLQDGAYNIRFQVINSGGWAWKAKIRLVLNGDSLTDVDETGGSGFYTGQVYEQEWQLSIVDGKLSEFH